MDYLSEECKSLLKTAGEKARELGHQFIGSEPVLMALLEEPTGLVARICTRNGISLEAIRSDARSVLRPGGPPLKDKVTKLTPPMQQTIELACKEAAAVGDHEVMAVHLLLAFLRQGADPMGIAVAGVLLTRNGLTWQMVRDSLNEPLGG